MIKNEDDQEIAIQQGLTNQQKYYVEYDFRDYQQDYYFSSSNPVTAIQQNGIVCFEATFADPLKCCYEVCMLQYQAYSEIVRENIDMDSLM